MSLLTLNAELTGKKTSERRELRELKNEEAGVKVVPKFYQKRHNWRFCTARTTFYSNVVKGYNLQHAVGLNTTLQLNYDLGRTLKQRQNLSDGVMLPVYPAD